MDMVRNDFDDGGARKPEIDEPYEDKTDEGNAFAQAVQQAKAAGLKKGDKFKVGDEEHTLRDSDFEQVNTNRINMVVGVEMGTRVKCKLGLKWTINGIDINCG